jgi:hypothetical protein
MDEPNHVVGNKLSAHRTKTCSHRKPKFLYKKFSRQQEASGKRFHLERESDLRRGRGERNDDVWVCSKKANQESRGKWSAGNKKWIFGSRRIIFHFLHRGGGNFALISPARASLRDVSHSRACVCVLRLRRRACTKSDPERVVISLDLITRAPAGRNYRRAAGRFDFRLCHSAVADSFLCGAARSGRPVI